MLNSSNALLDWDMQTYLPPAALSFRADQSAYLAGESHRLWTAPEMGDWLAQAEAAGYDQGSVEEVNLRRWKKSYERATKIPVALVERLKRETSLGHESWVEARKQSDFSIFQPHLERIVEINREMAQAWGYEGSPYNALLEGYETGAETKELRALFERLIPSLTALLGEALAGLGPRPKLPEGVYPVAAQQKLNRLVAEAMGFDLNAGRIDTTAHPFCTTIGRHDVRLTTRYDENDFTSSLYGIIHEVGHGMYEQGLVAEHFGCPMGEAISLGIHESQSRLWENQVARRPEFWECWFDRACHCFPQLKKSSAQELARYVNHVQRSFIRVEADEVTYDLHVILRFLLEVDLFEGRLEVADIPEAWNGRFRDMLGLEVPDSAHGCLQDVHWSMGSFGYFATYTLGSLNAAQLFAQANQELPMLEKKLAQGDYSPLLGWLRKKVHQHGQRYTPQELMQQATGSRTTETAYIQHLKNKVNWLVSA
jgi:carboxypeptidase Taq